MAMTKKEINNHRETINFYRSEVVYLATTGKEKQQGRKFAIMLGELVENIETIIGFEPTEKEKALFDWAFSNWRMAIEKFA